MSIEAIVPYEVLVSKIKFKGVLTKESFGGINNRDINSVERYRKAASRL